MKTMGKAEVEQYKWKLESHREDALRLIDRLARETRSFDVDSPQDSGDQSIGCLAKESLFQHTSQRRSRIRMIEAALRRISEGTYGVCASCGDDIAHKRLEALPWTDCCLRCQERSERELQLDSLPQTPNAGNPWKRAG